MIEILNILIAVQIISMLLLRWQQRTIIKRVKIATACAVVTLNGILLGGAFWCLLVRIIML